MKKCAVMFLGVLALFAVMALRNDKQAPAPLSALTVFAASSLQEVVDDISVEWRKARGQEIRVQYEASSMLARQIKEGASADIFITAAPEWLDRLEPVRVMERRDWLSNRLVCVVPRGMDTAGFDLKKLESLAMANDQVPAGKYAKAALAHQGITIPERTIYGANVRDVLSKVSAGGAQAGIVYVTDAQVDPAVKIAFTFPEDSHPDILYTAGLLTERGREFYGSLAAPSSLERALRRGFTQVK